jgi:hypothetical protein
MSIHQKPLPLCCTGYLCRSKLQLCTKINTNGWWFRQWDIKTETFLQLILISDRTKTASWHVEFGFHIKGSRKRGEGRKTFQLANGEFFVYYEMTEMKRFVHFWNLTTGRSKEHLQINGAFRKFRHIQEIYNLASSIYINKAGRRSGVVRGMNSLRSLRPWLRGFESRLGHGCLMCVGVFLCLCCPVFR